MTEQLLETGRRMLEHNRRLALLPQQPGLPAAYVSLLLDPSRLLADACGALFSATEVTEAAEEMPTTERGAARGLAEQLSPHTHKVASPAYTSPTISKPDKLEDGWFQPTPAQPRTEQEHHEMSAVLKQRMNQSLIEADESLRQASGPVRASKSRLPLTLVSSTSGPISDNEQPPASFDERLRPGFTVEQEARDFPLEQKTPLTSRASSIIQRGALLQPSTGRSEAEMDAFSSPDTTRSVAPAPPAADIQTRAAFSPQPFVSLEASLPSPAPNPRANFPRQQEESLLSKEVETHLLQHEGPLRHEESLRDEEPQASSVSFIHSPSRLAEVLNSNLSDERRAPFEALSLASSLASKSPEVPADSFAARDSIGRESLATDETRAPDADSAEASAASLIEAVLDELSERLQLEFLRTYGTSGE